MPDAQEPVRTFVPPDPQDPEDAIVDSETGQPWHLVSRDIARHRRVIDGVVRPVTLREFNKKKS